LARGSAAVLLVAIALLTGGSATRAADTCTLWASNAGSDRNPGSQAAPLRTVRRLVASLQPGQVGCLTPGQTFAERILFTRGGTPDAPIKLRTAPGRRAVIRGGISLAAGADNVLLAALAIQGEGGGRRAIVDVRSNGVGLLRDDISGPYLVNQSVPCVLLLGSTGTLIDGNTIHGCTRATRPRSVYAAGIYVASASRTTISNNFVYHTLGDAIVLAPDAQGTRVSRNIVDGNSSGIYLGGNGTDASSGNLIVDNIVSNSGRYNVHSGWAPGHLGRRNLVTRNCLWRGIKANLSGRGFTATRNRIVNPRYVDRHRRLALRPSSPCWSKRPASYRDATTDLGSPYPVLGRFVVSYRLRALPARVEVVRLGFDKLAPGSSVDLNCSKGCRLSEHLVVGGSGTATSRRLRGRWLRRGAQVDVRARRGGWVGSFARITVTGLPRGVSVSHACLPPVGPQNPVSCGRYGR
jgi:hypothetical protein